MFSQHDDSDVFFNRVPWCSRLLAVPNLRIQRLPSRTPKPHTGEDSLFAETLQTKRTISAALAFYPRPPPEAQSLDAFSVLVALGDGLNGWPAVLHGGIVASLIDESMGSLYMINKDRAHVRAVALGHKSGETPEELGAYTAELKVRYLRPVQTPGIVLVKCKVTRREGRKTWMRAIVLQKTGQLEELDGTIVECAIGEALFIEPRGASL